jgi:hypothetical protein
MAMPWVVFRTCYPSSQGMKRPKRGKKSERHSAILSLLVASPSEAVKFVDGVPVYAGGDMNVRRGETMEEIWKGDQPAILYFAEETLAGFTFFCSYVLQSQYTVKSNYFACNNLLFLFLLCMVSRTGAVFRRAMDGCFGGISHT